MLKAMSRQQLEDALLLATKRAPKEALRDGTAATSSDLDRILTLLALRHRREIVDCLWHGPRTAGEISKTIGVHRANISRYLNQLRDAGILDVTVSQHDGRERRVSLRAEAFATLQSWISQIDGLATRPATDRGAQDS